MQYFVKMGEMKVSSAPDVLSSSSLGSCVGVVIFDKKKKIGGLAHVMLPFKEITPNEELSPKFGNQAVILLLRGLEKMGCEKTSLEAKFAGGADMFLELEGAQDIGKRNAEEVRNALKATGIRIVGEDTGGNHGRTVSFNLDTGLYSITIRFEICLCAIHNG